MRSSGYTGHIPGIGQPPAQSTVRSIENIQYYLKIDSHVSDIPTAVGAHVVKDLGGADKPDRRR